MARGDEPRVNKKVKPNPQSGDDMRESECCASNICTHTIRKDAKNEATRCSLTQETFTVLSFSLWCHLCHKQLRAQNPSWQTAQQEAAGSAGSTEASLVRARCWSLSNEQKEYAADPSELLQYLTLMLIYETHASRPT